MNDSINGKETANRFRLALRALMGIPMWRALSAGRHYHANTSLELISIGLLAGSIIVTTRWVRGRFSTRHQR